MEESQLNGKNIGQGKMKDVYKVFIAGVPSVLTYGTMKNYFSKIGPITFIYGNRTAEDKEQTASYLEILNSPCKKGYCVIETPSIDTYEAILNGKHKLMGRDLICKRYLQDEDLIQHNQLINEKRLLLKKVPSRITESVLREFLESSYGEVSVLYVFKSTQEVKNLKPIKQKRYNTFSVTFKTKEPALLLAQMGLAEGPGCCTIEVRRFTHGFRFRSKDTPEGTCPPKSNESPLFKQKNETKKASTAVKNHLLMNDKYGHSHQMVEYFSPTKKTFSYQFNNEKERTVHSLKPTMKKYYTTQPFLNRNRNWNSRKLENVKFNVKRSL